MTIYYTVSHDEYELITSIADSYGELAKQLRVPAASVRKAYEREQKHWTKFRKVEIEEEDE